MGIKYSCEQCDFQATKKSKLTKHQQSVHIGITHPCQECEQQFTLTNSFTSHQKSMNIIGIINACAQCDYLATRKSDLNRNHQSLHGEKRCQKCGMTLTEKSKL
jgi:hypothetical protein